jgi:hypothetical protein
MASLGRDPMDRTFLAQAERHVSEGEKTIAHQRAILAELERDAHDADAKLARELLGSSKDCRRCMSQTATGYGLSWTAATSSS